VLEEKREREREHVRGGRRDRERARERKKRERKSKSLSVFVWYVCAFVGMRECMFTYISVRACIYIQANMPKTNIYACNTYIHTHTTYIVCLFVCMYAYINAFQNTIKYMDMSGYQDTLQHTCIFASSKVQIVALPSAVGSSTGISS